MYERVLSKHAFDMRRNDLIALGNFITHLYEPDNPKLLLMFYPLKNFYEMPELHFHNDNFN